MPETKQNLKRRILFLHPNFPAQFKHVAKAAGKEGHDTRFLCQTHHGRTIENVKRLTLKGRCGHEQLNELAGDQLQRSAKLASQFREGLIKLKESGWNPHIVISHSGWGCGLHLREVWPNCQHVAYVEWWFDPQSEFFNYDQHNTELNFSKNQAGKLWLRNQALALELVSANAIVAPTGWQAKQLPPLLKERCLVIHDGIDLNQFQPGSGTFSRDESVLTYGTRGMEPMRAFPQFIRSLPRLFEEHSNLRVEIAGLDEIYYGGKSPEGYKSWGNWAKNFLNQKNLGGKVTWLGYLSLNAYIKWLQQSSCHVYLTHPFVASWSLLEALACNCPMVVSDVSPVQEICQASKAVVTHADHRDPEAITRAISSVLKESKPKRSEAVLENYSRAASLKQWGYVAGVELTTSG